MFLDIIKQFNWVDIFVIIIFTRIGYVAIKSSLFNEFFKLLGTILAIYLSLHYFTNFSDFFRSRISLKSAPLEFLVFFSLAALAALGYLTLAILREAVSRLVKIQPLAQLDKLGGLALGLTRAFLLSGLLVFLLAVSTIDYARHGVKASYSGSHLFKFVPNIYRGVWHNLASKFMTKEKFNQTVSEIEEEFN